MRLILLIATVVGAALTMSRENTCLAQATDWLHRVRNLTDATVDIDLYREPGAGYRSYFLRPGQIGSGTLRTSRITVYAVYLGPNGVQYLVKSFDRLRDEGTIHLNAVIVNGKLDVRRSRF